MKKTYQLKKEEISRDWHLIDAKDKVLGRMSTEIAKYLIGKHKVDYTPHLDAGDYVVVINSLGVDLTGRKKKQKIYYSHSGYPKGFKKTKFSDMQKRNPNKIIELAVKNMLPKNKLQNPRLTRLKIFSDSKHPYSDKLK